MQVSFDSSSVHDSNIDNTYYSQSPSVRHPEEVWHTNSSNSTHRGLHVLETTPRGPCSPPPRPPQVSLTFGRYGTLAVPRALKICIRLLTTTYTPRHSTAT